MFNSINRIAFTLAAAAASVIALSACEPIEVDGYPTPADHTVPAVEWTAPTSKLPVTPAPVDPYSSNGTWLVPSEIDYGTYKATSTSDLFGYWALCADLACQPGPGMIQNEIVDASGYVVIGPDAVAVELDDIVLTRVG